MYNDGEDSFFKFRIFRFRHRIAGWLKVFDIKVTIELNNQGFKALNDFFQVLMTHCSTETHHQKDLSFRRVPLNITCERYLFGRKLSTKIII
jgi:hypothetical protein